MSEQQEHLQNLLNQRQTLIDEINDLNSQAAQKKELALRASGAIEYLQQIGVTLPEPSTPVPTDAPEAAEEVAADPESVTEPTPETPEG